MRIYLKNNVYDEALNRIRRLYEEFDDVCVSFSGGKDSAVCLELTLIVAREKNKLPLKVMWIDQESEWQGVNDYVKSVMYRKEVDPYWFQIPFKETMNTSYGEKFFYAWEEGAEWIREKDPISIKENTFGTERFHELFTKIPHSLFCNKFCFISGVRAEESPARTMAVTQISTYKDITWGKVLNKSKDQYTFYPIYDWSYTDIWKSIHINKWQYCKLYDKMYQYGLGINLMRISSIQHETAIHALFFMQEFEPETWNKVVKRLEGINTFSKLSKATFKCPKKLPWMFRSWKDYRMHLVDNLIQGEDKKIFNDKFSHYDNIYWGRKINESMSKTAISSILLNDFEMRKVGNWSKNADVGYWLQWSRGILKDHNHKNKFIEDSIKRGEKPKTND